MNNGDSSGQVLKISMEELYPVLKQTIEEGQSFALPVTGVSMSPTLRGGRDRVFLQQAKLPLNKLDLPLYRRENGKFVLHRILRVNPDGTYTCCGDNQCRPEPGIRADQIIALVSGFERKGKRYSVQDRSYRCWVRFWALCLPLRRAVNAVLRSRRHLKSWLNRKKRQTR